MRSATPSMCPNIIVALVFMPSSCAILMTVSHTSALHLPRPIFSRTAGAKISPPPPGMDCKPASFNFVRTQRTCASSVPPGVSKKLTNSITSGGLNAWTCTCGNVSRSNVSSSMYHSSGSSGFIPPCIKIWVPPMSTISCTFWSRASYSRVYASSSCPSRRKAQNVHFAVQIFV